MATYPIKMLNDENNNAFIPLTSSAAVMDENGLSIDHLMNEGKYKIQNNLTTEEAGIGVLDASQGKVLKDYVDNNRYTLSIASSETLGGIKVGENLEITEDGMLNAKGGVNSYIWDGSTGESAKALFQKWLDEFLETGIANNIVYGTDSSYSQYGLIEWTYEHNNSGHQLRFTFGNHNYGDIREQLNYKTLKCELDHDTNKIIENIYLDSNYTNVLPIYRYSKHMGYQKYMALSTNNDSEYTPTGDYHPATKKYVDDSIANIPQPDLSNYYTKAEVDAMITNVLNQLTYKPVEEEKTNISNILGEEADTIEYDMTNTEVNNSLNEIIGGNE